MLSVSWPPLSVTVTVPRPLLQHSIIGRSVYRGLTPTSTLLPTHRPINVTVLSLTVADDSVKQKLPLQSYLTFSVSWPPSV